MTEQQNPCVTQVDRDAVTAFHYAQVKRILAGDRTLGENRDAIEEAFARHREAAEAEAKAREAAMREAGDLIRDRLLAFVSALALETDCGPDVDAITAWDTLLGRESTGRLGFARAALTKEPDA